MPTKPDETKPGETKPDSKKPVPLVVVVPTDEKDKPIKGNIWTHGGTDWMKEGFSNMTDIQRSLYIIESMSSATKNPTGPKFPGYWMGTDPASDAKHKMVGGSEEQQESVLGELDKTAKDTAILRRLQHNYNRVKEATGDPTIDDMIDKLSKGEEPSTKPKTSAGTTSTTPPPATPTSGTTSTPPPSATATSAEKATASAVEKEVAAGAEKAAEKAAPKAAGAIAKGIGKGLARQVPIAGWGLAGYDAYQRAKEGDWVGAGLSAASALPWIGTAALATQIGRDAYKAAGDEEPAATKPPASASGPLIRPDDESAAEKARLQRPSVNAPAPVPPASTPSATAPSAPETPAPSVSTRPPVTPPPGEGKVGTALAQAGVSRSNRRDQAFVDKELGPGYKAGSAESNLALLAKFQKQSGKPSTTSATMAAQPARPAQTLDSKEDDDNYKQAIAQKEGMGRYDTTFGDTIDPKTGKLVHKFTAPPKPITQMTMKELDDWLRERSAKDPGTGAVGMYGFMPSTVRNYSQKLGLKPTDVFDQATQEKIQDAIMADQRATLEKNNIPVNQATLYMAHYVGPAGATRVINSASSNPNQAVVDAIIDPKYKSDPTAYENERNKILLRNPELGKLTTGQFQNVMANRVSQGQMMAQKKQSTANTAVAESKDDKKVAGRYSYDEFDDLVDRLRAKAKAQEKKHGPVDLGKLMQRLRDIEDKDDKPIKEEEPANLATNPDMQATSPGRQATSSSQQDTQAGLQATSQAGTPEQQQQRRDQAIDASTARGVADTIGSVAPPGTNTDALAQAIVNANDGKPLNQDQQRAMSTITPLVLKAAETPTAAGPLKTALQQAGILAKQGK